MITRYRLPARWEPFEFPSLGPGWSDLLDWWVQDPFLVSPRVFERLPAWVQQTMTMDISETDEALVIRVTLPGVRPEDVQVEEQGGVLLIRAEQREEQDLQRGRWLVRERRYGHWERAIRLPDNVAVDRIRADYARGVLTITVPKRTRGQSFLKRIGVSLPRFRLPRPRRQGGKAGQKPVKVKVKVK